MHLTAATEPVAGPGGTAGLDDIELLRLLREDVPYGDLTTEGLGIDRHAGAATFSARSAMTVCGIEEAARLFELRGARVLAATARGASVGPGTRLLHVEGPAGGLHQAWKSAQTLVEMASGIATATAQIVAAVRGVGKQPAVVATRKNFPGARALCALAVRAGGATAHRLGLSETLLVFPEHRAFLAAEDVAGSLQALRRSHPEKKLVVEVLDEVEALRLAEAGVDVLQLEKFTPQQVARTAQALARWAAPPLLVVAGGVSARNAAEYAQSGADILATSAPYWAPPADVQVVLGPARPSHG